MKIAAYVLDKNKKPLMPCYSYGRVKKWLRNKEVKIIEYKPFTIQFLRNTSNTITQKCILGIDPGRTNIGLCVVNEKGQELFSSNVLTRNKEIVDLMTKRLFHRNDRRTYRRRKKLRRFVKCHPECKGKVLFRRLPHYSKSIKINMCKNKQSRFCNRKRKEGWLTPTATQLLRTHINLVKKIQKFLPISELVLEINSFDIAKLENPNIKNWEYAKGKLFGFKNKEEYVYHQQEGKCLFCKHDIEHYHHVIWKSHGGSDTVDNIAGVCFKHHDLIHKDKKWDDKCVQKHGGLLKKYGALSVLNTIKNQLVKQLGNILSLNCTTGYETYQIRNNLNLTKDHYIDAWCIAVSSLKQYNAPIIENQYNIKQYRRHDRRLIYRYRNRNYRLLGSNKIVCKNRHKSCGQEIDSLEEYLQKNPTHVTKLVVEKAMNIRQNTKRIAKGGIFLHKKENNKRYVVEGTSKMLSFTSKNYPKGYIKIKDCIVVKKNSGLVFI